jgi:ABC-type nitrate/sulfonate/bicarbonate transport system substrate-binding protein
MTRKVVSKHGMAAAIAALALAGCGAQAGTSGASPAAPSVAQVATRIGATGVTTEPSPTLYASHEGSATWHGQSVDIATFADDTLRNSWESVAKTFGPILADGHDYAVTTG